jgi:hypothetical protein
MTSSVRRNALRPVTRRGGNGKGERSFWQELNGGREVVVRVGIKI